MSRCECSDVLFSAAGPLLGRDRELAAVEPAIAAAASGFGATLCVVGDAGIGKTRFLREVGARAHAQGLRTACGRCWEGDAPPLWPWTEILRGLGWSEGIARSESADRFEQLHGLAEWLGYEAKRQALCLVLDDVHWADVPTAWMLCHVARVRAPLLLVAAWRGPDARESSDRIEYLEQLRREATTIDLWGLRSPEISQYFAERGHELTQAQLDHLAAATAGNPFFLGEVARVWRADQPGVALTDGVRGAVRQRRRLLQEDTCRVLDAAAILGRRFDVDVLASAVGHPESFLSVLLADARVHGFLRQCDDASHEFCHDLTREAWCDSLDAQRRRTLHTEVARALQGHPDRLLHAAAIFDHLAAAGAPPAELAEWAERAARSHLSSSGFETTIRITSRVLGRVTYEFEEVDLSSLMALRAEALMRAGDLERGLAACDQAARSAREHRNAGALAATALARGFHAAFSMVDTEHVALLEEALGSLAGQEPLLRVRLEARLASALTPAIDPTRAQELARSAIHRAQQLGDPETLASVLALARGAFRPVDDLDERYAMDREALQLSACLGDALATLTTLHRLGLDEFERGDRWAGEGYLRQYAELGERLGNSRAALRTLQHQAFLATLDGNYQLARTRIAEVVLRQRRVPERPGPLDYFQLQCLQLARWWGQRAEIERAQADLTVPDRAAGLKCSACLWLGDQEGARRIYQQVSQTRIPTTHIDLMTRPELISAFGTAEEARCLYEVLAPFAGRHVVWWGTGGAGDGSIERLLGLLAATAGDERGAREHFARALRENERLGSPPILARTREDYAVALEKLGTEPRRVEALRRQAAETYERLDMSLDLERLGHRGACCAVPVSMPCPSPGPAPVFERRGAVWHVQFGPASITIKDSDGARYLAYLTTHPFREIHVLELMAERRRAESVAPHASVPSGAVLATLDAPALRAYRQRLEELRQEQEEALGFGDAVRSQKARLELEQITDELARALGLGGRSRVTGTPAERARVNLTQRIRKAIRLIADQHQALGHHLRTCIRTGQFCSYEPPPAP